MQHRKEDELGNIAITDEPFSPLAWSKQAMGQSKLRGVAKTLEFGKHSRFPPPNAISLRGSRRSISNVIGDDRARALRKESPEKVSIQARERKSLPLKIEGHRCLPLYFDRKTRK